MELEDLEAVVDMRLDIQAVNILVEESYSDAVCPRCERTGAVAGSTHERQWMCGYCCARGPLVRRGRRREDP